MTVENAESIQCMVRVKKPDHAHLERKAQKNPDNKHKHIATEINSLIRADRVRSERKEKRGK